MNHTALRPCPPTGKGVHRWIFASACHLARAKASEAEAITFLTTHATRKDQREIDDAVRNAFAAVRGFRRSRPTNRYRQSVSSKAWPSVDENLTQSIDASKYSLADLWEESPLRIDLATSPHQVLGLLFAAEDLLTAAVAPEYPRTQPLSQWGDSINHYRLIVPNAAVAQEGLTKDGRPSKRTLSMFPHRSYLVVEFDKATLDQQAARIRYLATKAPLTLVAYSGSKSLHAWFRCNNIEDDRLRPFFATACRLGADPSTWQAHQMVRLPQGFREISQTRQTVFYFNPPKV